jgi:hypothetical protein
MPNTWAISMTKSFVSTPVNSGHFDPWSRFLLQPEYHIGHLSYACSNRLTLIRS